MDTDKRFGPRINTNKHEPTHPRLILYFLGLMTGDPNLGALQIWMMGFAAVLLLPVAIALIFSLWTATRTSTTSTS